MDPLAPEKRSKIMRAIRAKDTSPELLVRRLLFGLGYRYRIHYSRLPGKPDLVFPRRKKVIFVHGCFWHQHPDPSCRDARMPSSNTDYWHPKLEATRGRDVSHRKKLSKMGWESLVIWQCELGSIDRVEEMLQEYLGPTTWDKQL